MTRPKVPDDKRQRTAQACDICKRRKQKCNGKTPCNTCVKRQLSCVYTPNNSPESTSTSALVSPAKRRHFDRRSRTHKTAANATESNAGASIQGGLLVPFVMNDSQRPDDQCQLRRIGAAHNRDTRARQNFHAEPDEEAEVYGQTRMLQDPRGRLLYVGDSATLSYLQLIRMIIDSAVGPSPFTLDPNRHMILEAAVTIPASVSIPPPVPDRDTAAILVNAFFTNTQGLIEVFDRQAFTQSFDQVYSNPLSVDPPFLCLLYLTWAIGLVLATPILGTPEDTVIKQLRADPVDRAESFFRGARCMEDPVTGFEDSDFWSVQALCLMSVYKLAVSRRNAAYAYYGMAVRSGFALGLHRIGDTTLIFDNDQVVVRRKLWRSLFVLDRFLATSLGRPTAISEEDCSIDALDSPQALAQNRMRAAQDDLSSKGLDAAVKTCQSIGQILKKVYSKRKISTRLAQEIAGECEMWNRRIHPDLHASKLFNGTITAAQGMTILHIQLLACHSIILLTRPFFLYQLIKAQKEKNSPKATRRTQSRLDKFSETCVAASTQTIALVQTAYQSQYLPQRNPFVIYFLFAATLIILSNEFSRLYKNKHYAESVTNSIKIISYCSTTDAQANRLLFILTSFYDVVEEQASKSAEMIQRTRSMHMDMSDGNTADPLAHLAAAHQRFVDQQVKMAISTLTGETNPSASSIPSAGLALVPTQEVSMAEPKLATNLQDDPATGNAMSPASNRTASSQAQSAQPGTEGGKSDSLGAEQEFDFDSFWDFASPQPVDIEDQSSDAQVSSTAMQEAGVAVETPVHARQMDIDTSTESHEQRSTMDISSGARFTAVNTGGC